MGYSLSGTGLGALYAVNASRIVSIKQGLQDLGLLPAGTQASTPDAAYALKQFAQRQGLPTSFVVWNGTTLQIDNALSDRFVAAVTEARSRPRPTSSSTPLTTQIVQSATKTDPSDAAMSPFVPSASTPAPSSSGPLDFLRRIPWWGWAIGVVGVGAVAMTLIKKRAPAKPAMVANRKRPSKTLRLKFRRARQHRLARKRARKMRRNRSSLSSASTRPYRRTSRKRKTPKLRLLVRGRGKKLYVFPKRKRAEVLRGKITLAPNGGSGDYLVQAQTKSGTWVNVHQAPYAAARRWQLLNHDKLIKKGYKSSGMIPVKDDFSRNGRIDVQYGQDGTGKGYAEDWIVKPYDLPYYHRMYSFKDFDHAKRFAESVVKTLKKYGYDARTLRSDQRIAANRRRSKRTA